MNGLLQSRLRAGQLRVLAILVRGDLNDAEWANRLFENDFNANDWSDMAYGLTIRTNITEYNAILERYMEVEYDDVSILHRIHLAERTAFGDWEHQARWLMNPANIAEPSATLDFLNAEEYNVMDIAE